MSDLPLPAHVRDAEARAEREFIKRTARSVVSERVRLAEVQPMVVAALVGTNQATVKESATGPVVGTVYKYDHVGTLVAGQTYDVLLVGGRPRAILGHITP